MVEQINIPMPNGYQETEVGIIPIDWEIKPLGDVSFMKGRIGWQGLNETEFTTNPEEPFLITGMNFKDGKIRWNEVYHVSWQRYEIAKEIQLKIGDVLMTKDGTIGKILFVDAIPYPHKATLNSHLLVFRPLHNNYHPIFFYYQLLSKTFKDFIELHKSGTTFFGISQESVSKYNAFLPSIHEQTTIATILSETDALIEKLECLITKKRNIKQGAMQELLKPREKWELKTYGEVFNFLTTATYSRAELIENEEVGYIHYGDIHTKLYFFLDAETFEFPTVSYQQAKNYHYLRDGDIIIVDASEDYAGVGKSVEVKNIKNKKIISGLHTFLLRDEKKILVDGFKGYLHASSFIKKQFDTLATGLKVYGVSRSNLKKVLIPVPSKEEQQIIANTLIDMDKEIEALEQKLHKYRMIKQGMMQVLLTGKIRLI